MHIPSLHLSCTDADGQARPLKSLNFEQVPRGVLMRSVQGLAFGKPGRRGQGGEADKPLSLGSWPGRRDMDPGGWEPHAGNEAARSRPWGRTLPVGPLYRRRGTPEVRLPGPGAHKQWSRV